jgi:acyl carrier protein
MNALTVEEKIRKYVSQNFLFSEKGYPYGDDISFLENGVVDSMNVMELVLFAEETFEIKVDDADIVPTNFDSVSNLARFIREKNPVLA